MLFIVLMLLCLLACFAYFNRDSKRIKRWRRELDLERHLYNFTKLYKEADGFTLSRQARVYNNAMEYTYGEIDFESFIALLSCFKPGPKTVFYDLGSGNGKAVIATAMVFDIRKSCGIELFQNLHHAAKRVHKRLSELADYNTTSKTIFFQQTDFLDVSLPDATLVFINSTAFFGNYWLTISRYLEHLPKGVIVLTSSKKIRSKTYKLLFTTSIKMSWGIVKVYAQEHFMPPVV